MAAAPMTALEPAALVLAILIAITAGTAEPTGPKRLLQSSLTLLLGAVEPLVLRQRKPFLELDAVAGHGVTVICVPFYGLIDPVLFRAPRKISAF
jgi:hypothetical protein